MKCFGRLKAKDLVDNPNLSEWSKEKLEKAIDDYEQKDFRVLTAILCELKRRELKETK